MSMTASPQTRQYARLMARTLLTRTTAYDARALMAGRIADDVVAGRSPHADHVATYALLHRLVLLRQAQWRAQVAS